MKARYVCSVAMLFGASLSYSQQASETKTLSLSGIGFGVGYHDMYNAEQVEGHVVFGGFANFFLVEKLWLNLRAEYFQKQTSTPWDVYSWKNATLGAALMHRVSTLSALGLGLGAEWIRPHRTSLPGAQITSIDPATGAMSLIPLSYDISDNLVRPSVFALANAEWPLGRGVSLNTGLSYKLSFVGRVYGRTPLNTLNTWGVLVGLKYDLTR